jgi:hypothetical protein
MNTRLRSIEVDVETARELEEIARERGTSVPRLLAAFVENEREPAVASYDELAELDRRWTAIEAGAPTVAHDDAVRWLKTWGTSAFRRWQDR